MKVELVTIIRPVTMSVISRYVKLFGHTSTEDVIRCYLQNMKDKEVRRHMKFLPRFDRVMYIFNVPYSVVNVHTLNIKPFMGDV